MNLKKFAVFMAVPALLCAGGWPVQGETMEGVQDSTIILETEQETMETTTYMVNGVDFKMIFVEAGTFTMGSDNTDVAFNESPAHQVTLTQDYLMGETQFFFRKLSVHNDRQIFLQQHGLDDRNENLHVLRPEYREFCLTSVHLWHTIKR